MTDREGGPVTTTAARRSIWAWGNESDEPSDAERQAAAHRLSAEHGAPVEARPLPTLAALDLRAPRIAPPDALAEFCHRDDYHRASRAYGRSFVDRVRAVNGDFASPPDIVARPRTEEEVRAVLEWCCDAGHVVIPFGGGSSVVDGVNPPESAGAVVTLDMAELNEVLSVDATSRAARIQAGAFGPQLEAKLKPHGFTLRHFPQSFEHSTLGGWIATRSGGHYATNHTHIDEFVESVRMLTPAGVWESRRLPGSGAGPSPDRLVIGSEGILGVITEAWMRIQARPTFRASAGVTFSSWEGAYKGCLRVAQAKQWPANLRLLDSVEGKNAAGLDGSRSLLIIGFESAELPQGEAIRQAVAIAREAGGMVDDEEILIDDGNGTPTGREGAVGTWRKSFIGAPYQDNLTMGLGLVADTFETSITWDRWPAFDAAIREQVGRVLQEVCGGGTLSCRFTHVYPDGPAPYYSFSGVGRQGAEIEQFRTIKQAASDAVIAAGGTITHHHAVGRLHRPWYDQQRPELFAEALRAAKRSLDPPGVMNPGVLIDP
jgi:alkyldihydroxyacetonephosphate synthase